MNITIRARPSARLRLKYALGLPGTPGEATPEFIAMVEQATADAITAATGATTATAQAGVATTAATNSGNSASAAAGSATAAASSATSAATSVAAIGTSVSDAAASATAAAGSATAAAGSATAATGSATAAAGSAATAGTAATNAGNSATAAAGSATAAATSATNAATSEANAAASAAKLIGTSTTSNSIATGSKSFTTQPGKFFAPGTALRITSDANPAVDWFSGISTAYSGSALTVSVDVVGGSGTHTDWTIQVSGARGGEGPPGAGAGNVNYEAGKPSPGRIIVAGTATDTIADGGLAISALATAAQGALADSAAQKASNLSDLANAGTARTNLGLGTAATTAATAYATAAQGATADTAIQPSGSNFTNTGLRVRDTNASHSLIIAPGSDLTADRTLTVTTGDANRTFSMGGNITIATTLATTGTFSSGGNFSTSSTFAVTGALSIGAAFTTGGVVNIANAFATSGAFAITLTATATTAVTLPTSGTLATTAQVALKEDLGLLAGVNTQTSSYTAVLTDIGKVVEMNNASANNFTIPPNSSVAFPVPSRIDVVQYGAGQTTIVAGAGVTIRSAGGKLKLTGQYSGASLYKRGTDEWVIVGDLVS